MVQLPDQDRPDITVIAEATMFNHHHLGQADCPMRDQARSHERQNRYDRYDSNLRAADG